MSETKLQAASRTEFGKGAARRIRRAHQVPAVLYGHGSDPVHITLPGHETMMALKHGGVNALLSIDIDGNTTLALPKQIQRHAVRGLIEHLDLLIVLKGEKVVVDVPVHAVGDAAPETMVNIENSSISLEAEATHIPDYIEVSIEGLEAGARILAKDLKLPRGSVIQGDEDLLIINISQEIEMDLESDEDETTEGDEAEGAEGAEGSDGEASSEE